VHALGERGINPTPRNGKKPVLGIQISPEQMKDLVSSTCISSQENPLVFYSLDDNPHEPHTNEKARDIGLRR
jgi:hypothetical protein